MDVSLPLLFFLLGTLPYVTREGKVTVEQVVLWTLLNKTQPKTELGRTLALIPNTSFVLRYFVLSPMGEIIN